MPVTLRPGQRLRGERGGDFLVVEWVGEGSYSRVYRAEGARGPVALKLAKVEVPGAEDRLHLECETHTRCVHAAIPALLDSGRTPSSAGAEPEVRWLARRWVEGSTLRQRLERDRCLPLVRALPVLLRISDAVVTLHAAGWSHGDLRPENILLEAGTQLAYLLDLGAARGGAGRRGEGATRGGGDRARSRAGSVPLDPPEPGRDLKQLGELLAWCLTGVDPTREPERLSLTAGYHAGVVQLWEEVRGGRLPGVAAFRERLQPLVRQLGLPEGTKRR
jgi:serine/threonine protein kinase